jgi:hypothetical protein
VPRNSPVPRAPLPARGVTSFRVTSCITSTGVTLSSTLIRAHVPDRVPLSNFSLSLSRESSQVAASPCCDTALPDVKLRIFPRMPGSLPRRSAGATPVIFPAFIGLPPVYIGSASRFYPLNRLHSGWVFRGCNHSVMFRPPALLATPVAPTAEAYASRQSWLLRPSRTRVVTFACIEYASRPNQAIDGAGTFTLPDSQP